MSSSRPIELTAQILEDPSKAVPLLRLLHFVTNAKGDPLSEAEVQDVMLRVWTKVPRCEESMISFLTEQEEQPSPTQKVA